MALTFGENIEAYEVLNFLGKGGFASVHRAKCKKTGVHVAIKMIDKKRMIESGLTERVHQEVAIHSRLKHPAIIELYTFFEDGQNIYLVLELAENGELQKYLKNNGQVLSEFEAGQIFKQVVNGLLYLHSHSILHRDISLSNLLLSKNMKVKIADFGLATQLTRPNEKHTTMCGTPNYISPEVATRTAHGLPVDVWGLGCLLYTLLVGKPPFDANAIQSTLTRVVMAPYVIPDYISTDAKDLIDRLLQKNPVQRIRVNEILIHPFMTSNARNSQSNNSNTIASQDSGVHTISSGASSNIARYRSRSEERRPLPAPQPVYHKNKLSAGDSVGYSSGCHTSLLENRHYSNKPQLMEKQYYGMSQSQNYLMNSAQTDQYDKPVSCQKAITRASKGNERCVCAHPSCDKHFGNPSHVNPYHSDNETSNYSNVLDGICKYQSSLNGDSKNRPIAKQIDPGGFKNFEIDFNNGLKLNEAHSTNLYKENFINNHKDNFEEFGSMSNSRHLHKKGEINNSAYHKYNPNEIKQILHNDNNEVFQQFAKPKSTEINYNPSVSSEVPRVQTSQQSKNDENNSKKLAGRNSPDTGRPAINRYIGVPPFSAVRLLPTRHRTKNAILSILASREVVVEFLKIKGHSKEERVVDVCRITEDGLRIIIYQPEQGRGVPVENSPPSTPFKGADEIYSYESLPAKHSKKYIYAARFVYLSRAKTPKITLYTELAKCQLMETMEDFEVGFYDGGKVTHSEASGVRLIDREGRSVSPPNPQNSDLHTSETRTMWEHYQQCLEKCRIVEKTISQLAHDATFFPVTVGRRPFPKNDTYSGRGKENISQNSTPRMLSFGISSMTGLSSNPQILKPHKPNHQNFEFARRVNVPGIGTATQSSSGEVQVTYSDGARLTVLSGDGINYSLPDGTFNNYSVKNVDELPSLVRSRLSEMPYVLKHLMTQPTNSARQGLR